MIIDSIRNTEKYFALGPRFERALRYLMETDLTLLGAGRVEIDGDEVFAIGNVYTTKPEAEGRWEAHRRYADIQFMVSGSERMGYTPIEATSEGVPYDEEKDLIFLNGEGNLFRVAAGYFAIFMPQDAHMPCIADGDPAPIRKVVMKVKL